MKTDLHKLRVLFLFVCTVIFLNSVQATVFSRKTGDWSDVTVGNGSWSLVAVGGVSCDCKPGAADSVVIDGGYTITQDNGASSVSSLYIATGATLTWAANNNALTIGSAGTSGTLTIDGTMTATTNNKNILFNGYLLQGTGTYAVKKDLELGYNVSTSATTNLIFDGAAGTFTLDMQGNTLITMAPLQ